MPASVFISYSRDNKPIADRLFHDLTRAGLDPWIDDHIPTETLWDDVLKHRIAACDQFLLVASPEAADPKRYVLRELAEAERLRKPIVRVLVADGGAPALDGWRPIQMVRMIGRYWSAVPKVLSDLGGQAVPIPLDVIAPDKPFRDFAAELRGCREFRVDGLPFLAVPVTPSGYGMGWLVGPADGTAPPAEQPLNVLFRFTGEVDNDDTLTEVLQYARGRGWPMWALLVTGRRAESKEGAGDWKYELPNDAPHIWQDAVEVSVRAVREWVKGRHPGLRLFFHGPAVLSFAVGAQLREMIGYELFNYQRSKVPPYMAVIQSRPV